MNAAVRAHVRASLWCSQVAHPQFCNIVLPFKVVYRLYLLSNINAKNIAEMPKKIRRYSAIFSGTFGFKLYISCLKLWAKWVIRAAISNHIFKKENRIYVQKVAFLDNFERIFENSDLQYQYRLQLYPSRCSITLLAMAFASPLSPYRLTPMARGACG